MNKLKRLIEEMDEDDLVNLKRDVDEGNMQRLLKERLDAKRKGPSVSCPVCGMSVNEQEGFHLQFGSSDFRQKATFDGVDCLEYFIERLKKKRS